jgi:hypothetical protein
VETIRDEGAVIPPTMSTTARIQYVFLPIRIAAKTSSTIRVTVA